MGPWLVTLPGLLGKDGELRVTRLVVGLRKNLRERVADAGVKVMAYLHLAGDSDMEDTELLESFYLDSSNNFRCEYPGRAINALLRRYYGSTMSVLRHFQG